MGDKRVIGIDLGRESIKCLILSGVKPDLKIDACYSSMLELPVDATDDQWRVATVAAMKKWRTDGVLGSDDVIVNAPSAHVLLRALKIETETFAQKITEEANQQLPFPIETLDWDYSVVATDGADSHVSLAAVKKEIVLEVLDLMKEAGLNPVAICNGAMGLANVLLNSNGGTVAESSAVLSLGYTATNLTVVDGKKVWMRSLPINGSTLIGGLVKGLELDPTEARKSFAKIDLSNETSLTECPATKNVKAGMTRLIMEITRSLTFYRSQLGGAKPSKLYIAGGYSSIKGLCQLLSEKLKIEVVVMDPLVGLGAPAVENKYLYGEVLGAALLGADATTYTMNLLPRDIQWQRKFDAKKPLLIAASFLLAVIFGGLSVMAIANKSGVADYSKQAQVSLEKVKACDGKITKTSKKTAAQVAINKELAELLWERDYLIYVVGKVSKIMPTNMWLNGIETVSFETEYQNSIMDMDGGGYGEVTDDAILKQPIKIILKGGYYGDWNAAMPEFEKQVVAIPGIASFRQAGSKTYKNYVEFALALDIDSDNDAVSELQEIKDTLQNSSRKRR